MIVVLKCALPAPKGKFPEQAVLEPLEKETVKFLLQHGADPHIENKYRVTPKQAAAGVRAADIRKLLP